MKNFIPLLHNQTLLKQTVPALRYAPGCDFTAWAEESRAKLQELLGLPFQPCDDAFEIETTAEHTEYSEVRFTFQSEEGYFVPCHLLLPKGGGKAKPLAVCLQGHSKGMHLSLGRPKYEGDEESIAGGRDFARQAVRAGFCALTVEQRNFGECGGTPDGPDCYISAMTALLLGRTTIGERVWDVSRALDTVARHFPQIGTNNVLCMGNSGGGTATFYAACLDTRIKLAMPSCAVCTYKDSIAAVEHCACNFIPQIAHYFDMGDLGGLIAPRALVVVAGEQDDIFPIAGVRESFERIQSLYDSAGAAKRCRLVISGGGHAFPPDKAWPVALELWEQLPKL